MDPRATSIRVLPEHVPYVLKNIKNDIKTLRQARKVSKTWQHYADRFYFCRVTLTPGNVENFIKWIQNKPKTPNDTNLLPDSSNGGTTSSVSLHISQFVHYIQIQNPISMTKYNMFKRTPADEYREFINKALMAIPTLKG
ncbi:hypothetical protein HDU76_003004, partial [Blyttiomyces sp. JEL0837]